MSSGTQKQWTVRGKGGWQDLVLDDQAAIPEIGDKDVLVKFSAASLNYRDLAISQGKYPWPTKDGVVPLSDGAGVVESVGKHVHRFRKGDKVITLFNQGHLAGSLDAYSMTTGVGGTVDGALRQYGAFDENGLVHMPSNLNFLEGASLSCAALTAWNALFGLKRLTPGD
ncbi:hypothetical protein LTR78_009954 [Recurvomyces mirabilis]|uniref:Alcohol dehydrogenase-like N-terminal domain-containing protein n=1 Tax=Recurvomyces mirabilis TaxID=574656 RepID=A0AAE0TN14_9PEZI|nr:hypothetical protein LTR78_009954 [Recurvomyces mirabilis]KAK5160386.1 hypothetical protein LTS14_001398 [Recurvomyces mirabilis]